MNKGCWISTQPRHKDRGQYANFGTAPKTATVSSVALKVCSLALGMMALNGTPVNVVHTQTGVFPSYMNSVQLKL